MRILIVIRALGSIYGGTSKVAINLAQSLGKNGMNVDLVATNANGNTFLEAPVLEWIDCETYRLKLFPFIGIQDYQFSLSLTRWLFMNIQCYDLVQSHGIFSVPNLAVYLACRRYHIPYVVVPHGMLEPWALNYKAFKKKFYYNCFEKPALNRASAIQVVASSEAKSIFSLNLKSPSVFISPNGIYKTDFDNLPNPNCFLDNFPEVREKTIILFLGRIDPKKGLDLLAEATDKVRSFFPKIHVVIAGPDNIQFLDKAKQFFTTNNCSDCVTFTGMLSGTLKYSALAAADYFIAPSYSEGFSLSVLEGMASGLPCVITTGCNFPEAESAQAAYIVNPNSIDLANAMIKFLSSPQSAKEMGKRAKDLVFASYTWDSIASNLITAYSAIINTQSLPDHIKLKNV